MNETIPVSLARCSNYKDPNLFNLTGDMLDKAELPITAQTRVLVKPNLLTANRLACTSAALTSAVCKWLLDRGCKIIIGDSPGFGRADSVAQKIGMSEALKQLGIKVCNLQDSRKVKLVVDSKTVTVKIAAKALECDYLLSLCRVKAHSQLRMTLSVKNCFGVVAGLQKAFLHSRFGESTEFFAKLLIKITEALPPMSGIADGIIAMQKTGPTNGTPFQLNLVGACASAPLLDYAILKILGINPEIVPIASQLQNITEKQYQNAFWPLEKPDSFMTGNFEYPKHLKSASFNPLRLVRSCIKRIWKNLGN